MTSISSRTTWLFPSWENGSAAHQRIIDLEDQQVAPHDFPGTGYAAFVSTNREFNTPVLRYDISRL